MTNFLKSEFLKQKHRFSLKLLWLGPVVTIALVLLLMGGNFFVEGSFNWWYTAILPGTLSMMAAFCASSEKKHNRHGLFSVCVKKEKLWVAQLILNTLLLLITNLTFFLLVSLMGVLFGIPIAFFNMFIASLVLFLTFAWQIPLFLFLSEKVGCFVSIMLCLFCNMGFGIFVSATKLWLIPFAIPSRLMCVILGILPNGLPVPIGHPCGDPSVLFPGILTTLVLYSALSFLTAIWFRRKEVR